MVNKVHYTWKDIEHMIDTINNLMFADNWRPDYIVGMTRGGLVPAVMMSNKTGIMMHALDVRFRDTDDNYDGPESNMWMAEDALANGKKILIIDDIKSELDKTLMSVFISMLEHIENQVIFSCIDDEFSSKINTKFEDFKKFHVEQLHQ